MFQRLDRFGAQPITDAKPQKPSRIAKTAQVDGPGRNRAKAAVYAVAQTHLGPAASLAGLNRGAAHRSKGTEHTTIPFQRAKHHTAALALVKELAGIRRHQLTLGMLALRTGKVGLQHDAHQ